MSDTVIRVENVSKRYRLGLVGTGTLKEDAARWWAKVRGKEDPTLKIGAKNTLEDKESQGHVWALQDINFEVKRGEVLGIIGKNGAGKSTLLKVLSRITAPTTGQIKMKGRVASLLEVGTGFHPELTGRENIFLNGAILGMTKSEVRNKLEEIVDFAGIAKYVDTPVKRYSSGMRVRLGFAVAAFLEPEILIVDEVLAVGDAEFQKKAIGKMQDISKGGGRTVLFVSHNMVSVKSLCTRAIMLQNGILFKEGQTDKIVDYYLKGEFKSNIPNVHQSAINLEGLNILFVGIKKKDATYEDIVTPKDDLELCVDYELENAGIYHITFVVQSDSAETLFTFSNTRVGQDLEAGSNQLVFELPKNFFNQGLFVFTLYVIKDRKISAHIEQSIISINILPDQAQIGGWMHKEPGFIKPHFNCRIRSIQK